MAFQKGHSGYKKKGKTNKKEKSYKKGGAQVVDTYFTSHTRFTKRKRGEKYLDPELIDYYINNDLDITELLDD